MDELSARLTASLDGTDLRDFQAAINHREQPTLLVDRAGKILFVNEATVRLTAMQGDEIARTGFLRLTMPAFRTQMMEGVAELQDGARKSISVRCMLDIEHLQGTWIDVSVERIDAPPGSRLGFFVTMDARFADEPGKISSYDLLGMASHEIRSTLMALQGAIRMRDFFAAKVIDEEKPTQKLDETISRSLEKLLYISNDLIEYSSMESGRMKVQLQKTDLCKSIADAALDAKDTATARNIDIEVIDAIDSIFVWADPVRLSQVLQNLIGNSIKYCPEGTKIWLRCGVRPDGRPVLEVEDSGPGLPNAVRERIFMPFNKGDNAANARMSSGLGLRISQLLMQAMGGKISLKEGQGVGTCFELDLAIVVDQP